MNFSVLIPYRPTHRIRAKSFEWLLRRYKKHFPNVQICVADSTEEEFNRSQARNLAYRDAEHDMLLIADADTVPEPLFILRAIDMVIDGAPWAIPYDTYYNLGVDATIRTLKQWPDEAVVFDDSECEHIIQSTAGMLVVPRAAWEEVDGYDEHFTGWGYEDNAFQLCLDTLVGKHVKVDGGRGIHLWHPAPETVRFDQPNIAHNRQLYEQYKRLSRNPDRLRRYIDERLHV